MILFLYSCPHGPSCVVGDIEAISCPIPISLKLGNTVLRVRTRELGLLLVVSVSVQQYMSGLFTTRVEFAIWGGVFFHPPGCGELFKPNNV